MPTSTHLNRVKERTTALGISDATFSTLAGFKPSLYSNAQRGIRQLSGDQELRLVNLSLLLVELASAISPLRLPTNVDDLQRLVSHVEDSKITPEEIREAVNAIFEPQEEENTRTIDVKPEQPPFRD